MSEKDEILEFEDFKLTFFSYIDLREQKKDLEKQINIQGFTMMSSGSRTTTYIHPKKNFVIKICYHNDKPAIEWLKHCENNWNHNEYYPVIYKKYLFNNFQKFICISEKLQKTSEIKCEFVTHFREFCKMYVSDLDTYDDNNYVKFYTDSFIFGEKNLLEDANFKKICFNINQICNEISGFRVDSNTDNFMIRNDNELVLIDPIFEL
jgi:hypothetical protein